MPLISQTPRAILIDVIPREMDKRTAERRLLELESLTQTYGGIIVVKLIQKRSTPDYRTYIGSGKLEEILILAHKEKIELLIVNNLLKPKQLFEIEEIIRKSKLKMQVWDRVDLILKIFSKHAKTSEAKLQIKLAAIHHMGPRIFGMGMEMMQQAGGIGTRGIGERNTEIMKRHLAEQEERVKKDLERLARSRLNHRQRRDRLGLKTVSIVGYTNAGKSSLLRSLTKKDAYVADELFATLDTRIGKLWIERPEGERMGSPLLLSDTIGFIQDLPPQLIDAFRSTLDETIDADLILHVIDVSDPWMKEKIVEVEEILNQLGVSKTPKMYVFNKIDAIKRFGKTKLQKDYKEFSPVFVSAVKKIGLDELKEKIRVLSSVA
ncbi:GTPase HflX [Candidatus Uhrbacteria bacterium]|nr:GTPase HflX [Candidatus Uhrbacteria bacterium]